MRSGHYFHFADVAAGSVRFRDLSSSPSYEMVEPDLSLGPLPMLYMLSVDKSSHPGTEPELCTP